MDRLYQDALGCIARHLEAWDLIALSRVSKAWYRLIRRQEFRARISFPFKPKYKLTVDQFATLSQMATSTEVYKLVHGEVGSGKTWLATSYLMRTYGEWLHCSSKTLPQMHALVVVPPTCVAQWSEFFLKYTDLPVLSNYESSAFYLEDWQKHLHRYGIIICSNLTSGRVQTLLNGRPHVILHDEAHNGVTSSYSEAGEVVGFTASIETFYRTAYQACSAWKVFELKAEALAGSIPPIEFVNYEPCGYRKKDGITIGLMCPEESRVLTAEVLDCIFSELVGYCHLPHFGYRIHGKKLLHFGGRHIVPDAESQARFLSVVSQVPKFEAVLQVAKTVKERREKLIIFDVNQHLIVALAYYLEHHGLDVAPFCTQYAPAERAKLLKRFCASGDVLIGSIEMLSEGHNIVEANHILFFRYPREPEAFKQAFGRCHRYPQKKTVFVHLVAACALERELALRAMEESFANIRTKRYQAELAEFQKLAAQEIIPPSSVTVRRVTQSLAYFIGF